MVCDALPVEYIMMSADVFLQSSGSRVFVAASWVSAWLMDSDARGRPKVAEIMNDVVRRFGTIPVHMTGLSVYVQT